MRIAFILPTLFWLSIATARPITKNNPTQQSHPGDMVGVNNNPVQQSRPGDMVGENNENQQSHRDNGVVKDYTPEDVEMHKEIVQSSDDQADIARRRARFAYKRMSSIDSNEYRHKYLNHIGEALEHEIRRKESQEWLADRKQQVPPTGRPRALIRLPRPPVSPPPTPPR